MTELVNFGTWLTNDDYLSEGSGASEKEWITLPHKNLTGIFKYPKMQPDSTTEHISEWLAYKIGALIGIECAKITIGYRNGRIGSFSEKINTETQELIEGVNFVKELLPQYDAKKMLDAASGEYYCLDFILDSTRDYVAVKVWIEMLLFDFLIGNSDRHQSNWALLKEDGEPKNRSPLYDNGSSLCCYVPDKDVAHLLTTCDRGPWNALSDTKSKSNIRIVRGTSKKTPTQREVAAFVIYKYPRIALPIAENILKLLTVEQISQLLSELPTEIFCIERKQMVQMFLQKKLNILSDLLKKGGD